MIIGLDFDGTCVTHDFPKIGRDIGAVPVLKEIIANGHKLVLNTMRSDIDNPTSDDYEILPQGGKYLTEAVDWFERNGIPLLGVNVNPTQSSWTKSPKVYAHLYIDDAALGCPLVSNGHKRPFVDWVAVRKILIRNGIIKPEVTLCEP